MLRLSCIAVLLVSGCVGDSSNPPPQDSGPDQTANDAAQPDVNNADADGGANPTWTLPLGAPSLLNAVGTDSAGNVYVAGSVSAPLSLGSVNIASTQGADAFIMKLDAKTKQPLWGVSYGGPGDELVLGMGVSASGVFIVGTTTGTSVQFGGTQLQIPTSTSFNLHSFIARIDPSDGAVGWAITPDASRAASTAHQSYCSAIGVDAPEFSVGCTYQGASFGYDSTQFAWTPAAGEYAFAIFRFTDGAQPVTQWTKSLGQAVGALYPRIALDTNGDTWFAAEYTGNTSNLYDEPSGALVLNAVGLDNLFALKITTTSKIIGPAKAWGVYPNGKQSSATFAITTAGTNVYVGGYYAGPAGTDFGLGALPTASQGLDMFTLDLTNVALATTWQFELGGPNVDSVRGIASDGTSTYLAMDWGSAAIPFNGQSLPAPGTNASAGGLGKIDALGKQGSFLASTSSSGSVGYLGVLLDPVSSTLYSVGYFQGQTTFDDGTTALGDMTNGNGFLVRRAKF